MHIYIYIYICTLKIPELLTQLITCHILNDYDLVNIIVSQKLYIGVNNIFPGITKENGLIFHLKDG